eukprot:SAG31_NODE_3478_length_4225_cov_1.670383_2_plen_85_part_00
MMRAEPPLFYAGAGTYRSLRSEQNRSQVQSPLRWQSEWERWDHAQTQLEQPAASVGLMTVDLTECHEPTNAFDSVELTATGGNR